MDWTRLTRINRVVIEITAEAAKRPGGLRRNQMIYIMLRKASCRLEQADLCEPDRGRPENQSERDSEGDHSYQTRWGWGSQV